MSETPQHVVMIKDAVRALMAADPATTAKSQQQKRNRKTALRYKLVGATCGKRKQLRKICVARQFGRCVPCGEDFGPDRPATVRFIVGLMRGGFAREDNCFATCAPCARQAQLAAAGKSPESAPSGGTAPATSPARAGEEG